MNYGGSLDIISLQYYPLKGSQAKALQAPTPPRPLQPWHFAAVLLGHVQPRRVLVAAAV
jgi:hypothetical protein